MRMFLVLMCLAVVASEATGEEQHGVYQGGIGKLPVVACFSGDSGAYYYMSRKTDISLEQTKDGWIETVSKDYEPVTTGRWTLTRDGDRLSGQWQSADGKRRQPIALVRTAQPKEDACSDAAFNAPRADTIVWTNSPAVTILGHGVVPLCAIDGKLKTFDLADAGDALRQRVRAYAKRMARDYSACIGTDTSPPGRDYSATDRIDTWTPSLFVLTRDSAYYCGGAHPDGDVEALVLDAVTAKPIEVKDWLAEMPDMETIGANYDMKDADCDLASFNPGADYVMWPVKAGLKLWPVLPHAVAACASEIIVPWDKLRLTEAGKKAVSALRGGR